MSTIQNIPDYVANISKNGPRPPESTIELTEMIGLDPETAYRVEISDQARRLLEISKAPVECAETRDIEYGPGDLADVKARLQDLKQSKSSLQSGLDALLKKAGINLGARDELKLELNSRGRILVGGVADRKTAKALEKAINGDEEFAKAFKEYRVLEQQVNANLKSITGMSLTDYKNRLEAVSRNQLDDDEIPVKNENGDKYTKEELLEFRDQDLYWVDSGFMQEIGEYIRMDQTRDVSTGNDILSDPDVAMRSEIRDVMKAVEKEFAERNAAIRAEFKATTDVERKNVENKYYRLESVTITIDETGAVAIEGAISGDPANHDAGKAYIEEAFLAAIAPDPETGEKSDFTIAAERLMHSYEDEYGEAPGDMQPLAKYENGAVGLRLSSESREAELGMAIEGEVSSFLAGEGVSGVETSVDERGRIIVKNFNTHDKPEQERIQNVVDRLNMELYKTPDENEDPDPSLAPLKSLLDHLSIFQFGGTTKLK